MRGDGEELVARLHGGLGLVLRRLGEPVGGENLAPRQHLIGDLEPVDQNSMGTPFPRAGLKDEVDEDVAQLAVVVSIELEERLPCAAYGVPVR